MAASAILAIKILADASKANSALDDSTAKTSKWSSGLSKAAGVATVGLAAVGAVMVSGVKAAADDAQAQAVLAKALQNSTGASDKAVAATEDWISKTSMATGVADDELRPALGGLVRATKDVNKAQELMTLALDVSAATGKDVQSVSGALSKAYAGNTASLGKLVPGIDKAVIASGDMDAIQKELNGTVGGSAAAAADTAAGQYKIFQVGLDELKEGIGAALLPILEQLVDRMSGIAKWATENQGKVNLLIGVFAALMGTIVAVNAVTKTAAAIQGVARAAAVLWTGAQWLLNAAMTANPIGLVVLAIAGLIAAFVLAYQKSETFRKIVDAAFHAVKAAAQFAWDWIKEHWPLLLAIITGPIGLAVLAIAKNWDSIQAGARAVLDWLRSSWDAIKGILTAPFDAAWSVISGIIEKIKSAVSAVGDAIKKIPVPKLPDLNPFSATAPATGGGAVAAPTYRGVARAPAAARGTTSGSGAGVHITVNGALDPEGVARQIRRILGGHDVRIGVSR